MGEGAELFARLNAGTAGITMDQANLGLGRLDPDTGFTGTDPTWGEIFLQPFLGVRSGGWYGEVSVVGARTFGEGDSGGFSEGGDGTWDVETAFAGWRSGDAAKDQDAPVVDISVGRQTLNIGDGFLIDDGNFDFADDSGIWLVPRQAFQRTLLARLDFRAWHADLFFLESDPDNDEPALAGTNLEYQFPGSGHVGALYFQILDADTPSLFGARQGMEVTSLRVNGYRPPFLAPLALWGEATRQRGEGRLATFDASAWYAEAVWHFDTLPWTPALSYRRGYFSGDADLTDSLRRDFDPLFYGFDQRGWGTWYQGEVVGGWLLFNSNMRNHQVHLSARPSDTLTIGAIGASFALAESNYLGVPVTSRHFGEEINLYADWYLSEKVFLSAAWAYMVPGEGAEQALGDDGHFQILEAGLYFFF